MAAAVVFDLFHTLVDPEPHKPADFDAIHEVAAVVDVDVAALAEFWERTEVEQETTAIDLVDLVQRHTGPLSASQRAAIDDIFGVGKDESIRRPLAELVDLVASISERAAVGVLSNCEAREVHTWPGSPLASHVDVIVRSCDFGCMKPDPRIYAEVLRLLDVGAAESVYVANGSSDELGGARRAGFGRVVHMNAFDRLHGLVSVDDQRLRASQADESVGTVADLTEILLS